MTAGEWLSERQRSEYNGGNRNYGGNNRGSCNTDIVHMSDYKWCHGPKCHESRTQDRIRGSKGSKVLRTRKIKINDNGWPSGFYKYFCSNTCYNNFADKHAEQIIKIEPRNEPLETPIEDPKKVKHTGGYTYADGTQHTWTTTEIKERGVDTSME